MIKNDEEFVCENCGAFVKQLKYTSRDHCPECLYSKHVDNVPGDRLNPCKGILEPIGYEFKAGKERIIYKCQKCSEIRKNIIAKDDNRELIIELTAKVIEE